MWLLRRGYSAVAALVVKAEPKYLVLVQEFEDGKPLQLRSASPFYEVANINITQLNIQYIIIPQLETS